MSDFPIYDVSVIGAGASGLLCALECVRAGKKVLLLEKDPLPGRKILASGNGRCNLTNTQVTPAFYHAPKELIENTLTRFPFDKCKRYFEELGVTLTEEEDGRIFPATGKSSAVLEPLKLALIEGGVTFSPAQEVCRITPGTPFTLQTKQGQKFKSRRVVLACGSCAFPQLTGSNSGYELAKQLGHTLVEPKPALCALNIKEKAVARLQGIRIQAEITARSGQRLLAKAQGEILFTAYGISGPAVLNISGSISRELSKTPVQVDLNLFANQPDFIPFMQRRKEIFGQRRAKDFFAGMLHENITNLLIDFAGIRKNCPVKDWTPGTWQHVLSVLQKWTFTVESLRTWTEAMVATGGVNTREINYNTFESLKCPGVFITGELLDVDGRSGGFNLHFAWSSGFTAARKLLEV